MNFKKLALATAVAVVPMSAFAAEVLDDSDLAAATGQDGIAITMDVNVTTDTLVHDTDGIDAGFQAGYAEDGAIVIDNMSVTANGIEVQIDAGDNANTGTATGAGAVLNVNVNLTGGVTLVTGTLGVANSNRDNGTWGYDGAVATVLASTTISLGAMDLNIQLGNEAQTGANAGADMIAIDTTITGGVTLNNVAVNDVNSGGAIGMSTLSLIDNGGTDLTVQADINVENTGGINNNGGLEIGLATLGSATGMDVRITRQYIGNGTDFIGDIEVIGLDLTGTIVVSGK